MPVRLGAALVAEFVGTFALVFVGILAINNQPKGGDLVLVALAHGLALATLISATMQTSGGHLNPAVTIGFLVTGKIKPVAAVSYVVIQLLAAVIASLAVYFILGTDGASAVIAVGTPGFKPPTGASEALVAEIIATFFLVFVVWGTAADPRARNVGGFAIGLTVALDIMAVGPISGASMNPARSFGPTLVASVLGHNLWAQHWVYWVGPVVGGALAALTYRSVLWPRTERTEPGGFEVLPPKQG